MYKIFKKKSAKKGNTKNGIKGYWLVSSRRLTPITSKVTSFQILTGYVSLKFIRLLRVVIFSQQRRYWGSNNDSK